MFESLEVSQTKRKRKKPSPIDDLKSIHEDFNHKGRIKKSRKEKIYHHLRAGICPEVGFRSDPWNSCGRGHSIIVYEI